MLLENQKEIASTAKSKGTMKKTQIVVLVFDIFFLLYFNVLWLLTTTSFRPRMRCVCRNKCFCLILSMCLCSCANSYGFLCHPRQAIQDYVYTENFHLAIELRRNQSKFCQFAFTYLDSESEVLFILYFKRNYFFF